MDYIRRHWRGELSLGVSFWVNFALLNALSVGVTQIDWGLGSLYPVTAARIALAHYFLPVIVVYPWQVIGLWRCCERRIAETDKLALARVIQLVVVFGVLGTFGNVIGVFPVAKDLFGLAFPSGKWQEWKITITNDGRRIHLVGSLGFGVSDEISQLLEANPHIEGIILDSSGGRLYEGRRLASLIWGGPLDTYSLSRCNSACTTAFVAGKRRFLATGASLGFHGYHSTLEAEVFDVDMADEEAIDRGIFERSGVAVAFLDQMFDASSKDMWYPTVDELLEANVVHAVVEHSQIAPPAELIEATEARDLAERALGKFPVYESIRKHEPELYEEMANAFADKLASGGSAAEFGAMGRAYLGPLTARLLPKTGDEEIVGFTRVLVETLRELEEKDPLGCMKFLYPGQYGPSGVSRYVDEDLSERMLSSMNDAIISGFEGEADAIDVAAAEAVIEDLWEPLGDEIAYLDTSYLRTRDDYARHCSAVALMYESILSKELAAASNALRYMMAGEDVGGVSR